MSRFGGGTKSRAALALAVSLWIATGGVASAATETLRNGVSITHDGTNLTAIDLINWQSTDQATRSVYLGNTYTSGLGAGSITGEILDTSGVEIGDSIPILTTASGGFFTDSQIAEAIRYKEGQSATYSANGVTLMGTEAKGVKARGDGKGILYQRGASFAVAKLSFGAMTWGTACSPGPGYNFTPETTVDDSGLSFTNPADVTGTTTLYLDAPVLFGGSLMDIPETTKNLSYTYSPVSGVTVEGVINGSYQTVITDNTLQIKSIQYTATANKATKLTFTNVEWKDSGALIDHATDATKNIDFNGAAVDTTNLAFTNPEARSEGDSMTLVANVGNMSATTNTVSQSYAMNPVDGLSIDAALNGSVALSGSDLTYSVTSNKATKLTFGDVEWKDTGALIDHATDATKNIDFNGADVDTTNINFTNISELDANKKMTLVKDFGNTVGTITGAKYKVGSTLEGTGKASLVDSDGDGTDDALIFTAETKAEKMTAQEQTHNTVMGAEVGMAALSVGNDFIGAATEGLSLASNIGADGVSSYAKMGGGTMRQETGSHVDSHTWNAILALGHKNEKERGTFEYGAFFEYGSGNYTTHNGNERGDGSARYTGGGLLAKWTAARGFYVEGSLRAGTVHDDARNVLRDANGVPYSYETNANYFGGHVGVGKEFTLNNGNTVDVYGKYFVNRKNGVDFNAGGQYNLDAVTSQILRVGARYTVKSRKWNFYAGAAYEHELDGKANGTADGVAIRGADTSGGSFRGELGATVTPDKNVPVTLDFNLTGFAGKKQGVSGGVSVALMF